jgi:murein L,D-transpeptidase YafK
MTSKDKNNGIMEFTIRPVAPDLIKPYFYGILLSLLLICPLSCNQEVKTCESNLNFNTKLETKAIKDTTDSIIMASDIKLDSVEDIDLSKEKQAAYINSRIKKLSNSIVTKWCKEAGFNKLPDYILFRVFKYESQFEIWGREGNEGPLSLIKTVQVCAIESSPGPKLKGWDYNTAEGFYTYNIYYTSPSWYMYVKLTKEEINKTGAYGNGSCFKMFINYPNQLDIANSKKIYGQIHNIGNICIHGNCVTACCVSFENELWIVVFAFGLLHDLDYGKPNVYLFPCRFEKTDVRDLFNTQTNYNLKDSVVLYPFWENLKEGYYKFQKDHKPLKFRATQNGYFFD